MRRIRNIIILLFLPLTLAAQDNKLSLQFSQILFRDLADTIQKTIPVKIYYSNKWVDSLYLRVNAENESLSALLNKSLSNSGLSFFITDDNKLILSKGYTIKTNFLKEYREFLKKKVTMPDTVVYYTAPEKKDESTINDEYKIFKIGNLSNLKKSGPAHLSGNLKVIGSGDPVVGAIIYVDKLKAGAVTNNAGYYSLEVPKGQYQIEYRMVGMKTTRRNVILYSDGTLDVGLVESTNLLKEVTVSASKENNVRDVKMGIEKISMKMLKQIPMGLGEVDLLKSSLMLPGVQSTGEASNGFNIRGGSIDQNLILFDGAPIINPSHFFGFFSAFNSDIIQDVTLYKSGIPARYGGRVSSVMDIILKEGSMEKFNVSGGISPMTGRLMVEGPIVKNKSSFIISGRTTYSDWVLGKLKDNQLKQSSAGFNDIQGLLTFDIDKKNSISVSGYLSTDHFELYKESAIEYENLTSSVKWDHRFNSRFSSEYSAILSNYSYRLDSKDNPMTDNSLKYKLDQTIFRADFTYLLSEQNKMEFGLDATNYMLSPGNQVPLGLLSTKEAKSLEKEHAIEPSLYFSDEYEFTPRFVVSGGLRFTMFSSFGPKSVYQYAEGLPRTVGNMTDTLFYKSGQIIKMYPELEYRFSSRFIITPDISIKGGFQRNYQYLNMISNTTSMSPTDIWKLSDNFVKPQRGDQFSIGIYKNFNRKGSELSIEAYYKNLKNIIDYKGGAVLLMNEHLETDILNATGKAYGIEFMLKKETGKITGWISYVYSRSFHKVAGNSEEETINGGKYFPADFDKPNDLKLVTNIKFLRRLNFTTNLVYSTGRPITYPVAYFNFYNVTRVFYSERNEFRIPDYLRLDLSATFNGNLKARKLNHSSFNFTVYNVLGRRNPYSIYFKIEDGVVNGYKMSIFGQPIFMLTYNFRIRGNASTDF